MPTKPTSQTSPTAAPASTNQFLDPSRTYRSSFGTPFKVTAEGKKTFAEAPEYDPNFLLSPTGDVSWRGKYTGYIGEGGQSMAGSRPEGQVGGPGAIDVYKTYTDVKGKEFRVDPTGRKYYNIGQVDPGVFGADASGWTMTGTGDVYSKGRQTGYAGKGDWIVQGLNPESTGIVGFGGAPGYPYVGEGGLIGGGIGGAAGAPGQATVQAATPYVLGQTQPVTPQPTASAVLSDPIQSRLQQLRGPQDQVAAQTGMTQEQDVNWQMNRILEAGNPLINRAMEQARRDVQTEMNARGLSNTSMAVEMAEKSAWDAAYNIALPMAQDVAKAEQQTASANLQSRAAFQQTGMQLRSQEAQQRAQLASGEIIQNLTNNNQITLKEIDRITQLQGIQLSEENKRLMHQITEGNKLALQTNASVATAYSNTVSAIGQVYSNPELDGAQQHMAAQWYMNQFQSYTEFQDIVNDTNYAAQLDWGSSGGRSGTGLVAGTAAGSQQAAPGEFGPFGVVGAPGEVRTIVVTDPTGRTVGRDQNYKWNEITGTWQSTAPGFLPGGAITPVG